MVGKRDRERRNLGEDALRAVRLDHRAQHRMVVDHGSPGPGEPLKIEPPQPELDINVAGHFPEFDQALAAQPVGLLQRASAGRGRARRPDRPGAAPLRPSAG